MIGKSMSRECGYEGWVHELWAAPYAATCVRPYGHELVGAKIHTSAEGKPLRPSAHECSAKCHSTGCKKVNT